MSLKSFHLFFISVSILLSAFFAAWCFKEYQLSESSNTLALGIFSLTSLLGLTCYLGWFLKKTRAIGYLVLGFLFFNNIAQACPVCIGKSNSPLVQAANTGVIFMLVAIGIVLTGLISLFGLWAYRIRRLSQKLVEPT